MLLREILLLDTRNLTHYYEKSKTLLREMTRESHEVKQARGVMEARGV